MVDFCSGHSLVSVLSDGVPRGFALTARAGHRGDGRHGGAAGVPQAAVERDEQLARACVVPMLAQPDALPRT